MSGIHRIQQLRNQQRVPTTSKTSSPSQEIYFKDGDQAFIQSFATGNDDDKYFDNIEMYTWPNEQGRGYHNLLKHADIDDSVVPTDVSPSHKFAFWGYVYEIFHGQLTERGREAGWEPLEDPTGKKIYKEIINAYKVISLSYGRNEYVFNQLFDIYNDWGRLDKGIVRVKRTGAGMQDTSYTIAATTREAQAPAPENTLPTIEEYFCERYGELWQPQSSTNGSAESTSNISQDDIDSLF
tara:strand:- start:3684 stop:4400 length:717 start_codon:yes stop_codon:yes gene_type:complete